jgi:glycosyltransferase-like protein LARGE
MFLILILFVNNVKGMSCQRPDGCGDGDGNKMAYSKSVPARSKDSSYGLAREGYDAVDGYSDNHLARDDDAFRDLVEESAQCAKETAGNGVAVSKRGLSNQEQEGGPDGVTSTLVRVGAGHVVATWSTRDEKKNKNNPVDVNDVTLCTQLDESRLKMLFGQCRNWGGPMSTVVYLATGAMGSVDAYNAIVTMKKKIDYVYETVARHGWCDLDVALQVEHDQPNSWSYPYNANRNQAIARAKTRLVLLLDVDFLPSKGLRESILQKKVWSDLLQATQERREVLVLPAFETRQSIRDVRKGCAVARSAASGSKDDLHEMFKNGDVVRFAPFFERGHGATNYSKWFSLTEAEDEKYASSDLAYNSSCSICGYEIEPEVGYEPFILMSRMHVPWFDERFRGYGWDKILHIYHLAKAGFKFVAHPSAWVVHRPHEPSAAYKKTFSGPAYTKKHRPTEELKKLDVIAREVMRDIRRLEYPTSGVSSLQVCGLKELVAAKAARSDQDSKSKIRPS